MTHVIEQKGCELIYFVMRQQPLAKPGADIRSCVSAHFVGWEQLKGHCAKRPRCCVNPHFVGPLGRGRSTVVGTTQ